MARVKKGKNEAFRVGTKIDSQTMWRIAVYIRLSREDGNVINQKKILTEYLESCFDGRYIIVDFYTDDGLTGTDDTRAEFMRMIKDIEQGKVSCMLCKTLARAFRNYSDQGYYLEYYFPQRNVRFISTGDPKIDTFTNPEAITGLEVPITGLMNDRFAGRTSSDVRRTFNTKRRKGEFIGAFPPYGYLKDPSDKNHLILDPDIVLIKKDMMTWIVRDGMSLSGVAKKLNDLGILNPTAYKRSKGFHYHNPNAKDNDGLWTGSTVKRMLLDKVNLGHMVQGRQRIVSYKVHDKVAVPKDEWFYVENTHEPTFSKEEYDTLERILQRDTRTPHKTHNVYLFAGFLRCADCDKAMQRRSAKGHVYYACRTHLEKSKTKCTRHSIRADQLETAVLACLQAQIAFLESLADLVDEINSTPVAETPSKHMEKMLSDKCRELKKARTASESLYADWKSGEITREEYRHMKVKYEGQIMQLNSAIMNLEEEQRSMSASVSSENALFKEICKYQNVQKLDRGILAELIDMIIVHENKEITIAFRFADELDRILELAEQSTCENRSAWPLSFF